MTQPAAPAKVEPVMKITSAQRVAFAGKTGSGKTFLARYLTRSFKRLIVIDPKNVLGIPNWNLDELDSKTLKSLRKGEAGRVRIWEPPAFDASGFPVWDSVFDFAWELGNITIYIDEMYSVCNNGRMSWPLRRLYTQGRQPGIGVWAATQRPSFVPQEMFSEAEWDFIFMLRLEKDRKKIADGSGCTEVLEPIRDIHGFWIYNELWSTAIYKEQFQPPGKLYKARWDVEQELARPKPVQSGNYRIPIKKAG
jgi:hypothetical protein